MELLIFDLVFQLQCCPLALSTISDNYRPIIRVFMIAQLTKDVCTCGMRELPQGDPTKLDHACTSERDVYSDACGAQNRNIFLVLMWLHIVSSDQYPFTTIDHKLMISGHSYLPNDHDFGHTELSWKKSNTIYVPEDWKKVVTGDCHKNPFKVRKMKLKDFVSLKDLKKAVVSRKVNTSGSKVEWLKIQWVSVSKDKPLQFQYPYSHNTLEVWKTVDLKRKAKGRPPDVGRLTLPPL